MPTVKWLRNMTDYLHFAYFWLWHALLNCVFFPWRQTNHPTFNEFPFIYTAETHTPLTHKVPLQSTEFLTFYLTLMQCRLILTVSLSQSPALELVCERLLSTSDLEAEITLIKCYWRVMLVKDCREGVIRRSSFILKAVQFPVWFILCMTDLSQSDKC